MNNGLRLVQLMKNRACQYGTKYSPNEAMIGTPLNIYLMSSLFPVSMIAKLKIEELQVALESIIYMSFLVTTKIMN